MQQKSTILTHRTPALSGDSARTTSTCKRRSAISAVTALTLSLLAAPLLGCGPLRMPGSDHGVSTNPTGAPGDSPFQTPSDAPTAGTAQGPMYNGPVDAGPLATLYPELAHAPAPDWVKQGMRLTYYSAAAIVPGTGSDWIEDPNGTWKTPDGRTWRRETHPGKSYGAGGDGFTQLEISAVNANAVAVDVRSYTYVQRTAPALLMRSGFVGASGAGSDYWVNPDVLKNIPDSDTGALTVMRMSYQTNSGSRPAVWIASKTGKGNSVWVYDQATGVLLHSGASSAGKDPGVIGNDEPSNTPSALLTETTLVEQRQVDTPWAADPMPAWANTVQDVEYQGSVMTYIPGGPPMGLPYSVSVKPQTRGPGWACFAVSSAAGGGNGLPPNRAQWLQMSGPGQFASLWIAPQALARLRPGQQLDRDPYTLVSIQVGQPVRGANGSQLAVITETNPVQEIDLGYDSQTGMLVSVRTVDNVMHTVTQISLTGKQ